MSITITTDVFCDYCGNWEHGVVGNTARSVDARRRVREQGWVRCWDSERRMRLDKCPGCQEEISPEQDEG